ncbi:hypothetical protein ACLB2K_011747 [Fragaria x ananassa]
MSITKYQNDKELYPSFNNRFQPTPNSIPPNSTHSASLLQSIDAASLLQSIDAAASLLTLSRPQPSLLQSIAAASVHHRRCFTPSPPLHRAKFFFFRQNLQREKLKVPQKRARQEEEEDDTEEEEVEQYFIEIRALEVEEIEKDDKDEEEDEDEDLEKISHTQQKCENEEEKISRRKKSSQQSTIFGKTKGSIFRKMIHDKLTEELNKIKNKETEPRKIASLIIMYLLATFFFSTSGSQIEWQLVLTCEDLEAINKINWSRKVIEAFHEGVKKHVKGKPKGLNGCVVLPLYCFLERTKIKEKIQKKQADMPRFELVAQGPWNDEEESTSGSEEYGIPDEHGTPSFEEWVPSSSQQEVEENKRVGDNFKTLLTDLKEEIPEDLNEKLKELGKANEELQSRINDYVHKLQLADNKIKQLEMEKRAQDSLNKALKRKLKKAKSSANGPPEQKRQFGGGRVWLPRR